MKAFLALLTVVLFSSCGVTTSYDENGYVTERKAYVDPSGVVIGLAHDPYVPDYCEPHYRYRPYYYTPY